MSLSMSTDPGPPAPAPDVALDVELLGRRGCHLCEQARAALARIARETSVPLRLVETDVDSEFALRERYGLLVPVVLLNGERISELRLDEGAVRARLVAAAQPKEPPQAAGPVAAPATIRTGAT